MGKTVRKLKHPSCENCGKRVIYCKCKVTRFPTNPRRLPTMGQQERGKMEWDRA